MTTCTMIMNTIVPLNELLVCLDNLKHCITQRLYCIIDKQKIALYLWILLPHTYKQIIQNKVHDMYSLYYKSLNIIEKKYQMQ